MKNVYEVILGPVISEQSMEQTDLKKYVFKVAKNASKIEIKEAVEKIFNVKVAKVNTVRTQGKLRRQGRYPQGRTAEVKKAVVRLTPDSSPIEFFEGMV